MVKGAVLSQVHCVWVFITEQIDCSCPYSFSYVVLLLCLISFGTVKGKRGIWPGGGCFFWVFLASLLKQPM